ncbi:HNH endonuclease [soil metagenome]
MYSLSVPTTTALSAFDAAISTIKDKSRRAPYTAAAPIVQERCDSFDRLGASQTFHQADGSAFDVGGLSKNSMVDLYDVQFNQRVGTKAIRDGIKNAAPNELCPYCGEGRVTELDHYLPKSQFAGTTVHPANLVPSCHDCNSKKHFYHPGPTDPAVLHPYFDSAYTTQWLSASVGESSIHLAAIKFEVDSSVADPHLIGRLNAHMNVFDLRRRFGVWAAQSLTNFEGYIRTDHGRSMTLDQARQHLQRTALQQSGGRLNSWEGAAHEAMSESDWYLAGHLGLG